VSDQPSPEEIAAAAEAARIAALIEELVGAFNGAIKYTPMLKDHPDWSKEQCLAFARQWHAEAINGLRLSLRLEREGHGRWDVVFPRWNDGIPYCRNIATAAMLSEARAS